MSTKQLSGRSLIRVGTTVIVVVIIAVSLYIYYASRAVSGGAKYRNMATQQHTAAVLNSFKTAIQQYTKDCGSPPSETFGLSALMTNSGGVSGWAGPYLKWKEDADAWGTPYRYKLIDGKPVVISAGPDKNFETRDDLQ
ncbi:MAG: type II secretion system protein GspG [Verrucomicrobia bacterium]|nr:type II secretion system protein GspG [Verrucomicrobiota bacterium]MCG2678749.1 type II secretion system protein GspG [Kiritimatiellia bacterium]